MEDAYNKDLSGRDLDRQFHNLGDWLIGKEQTGDAVLTLSRIKPHTDFQARHESGIAAAEPGLYFVRMSAAGRLYVQRFAVAR